jgi:uncharacterized protein YjiS (DUF1127 family)
MGKMLAWWIRLQGKGAAIYEAIQHAQRARADREVLARLDSRSLRDIGLDSWNVHLAERAEAQRQLQLRRLAAARIGTY